MCARGAAVASLGAARDEPFRGRRCPGPRRRGQQPRGWCPLPPPSGRSQTPGPRAARRRWQCRPAPPQRAAAVGAWKHGEVASAMGRGIRGCRRDRARAQRCVRAGKTHCVARMASYLAAKAVPLGPCCSTLSAACALDWGDVMDGGERRRELVCIVFCVCVCVFLGGRVFGCESGRCVPLRECMVRLCGC